MGKNKREGKIEMMSIRVALYQFGGEKAFAGGDYVRGEDELQSD